MKKVPAFDIKWVIYFMTACIGWDVYWSTYDWYYEATPMLLRVQVITTIVQIITTVVMYTMARIRGDI